LGWAVRIESESESASESESEKYTGENEIAQLNGILVTAGSNLVFLNRMTKSYG
jgi:hypothetical protein